MSTVVRIGDASWHKTTQSLVRGGRQIRLTRLEKGLISYLADRVGQVVATGQLLQDVWGYAPTVRTRAVDNTVSRLRVKLGRDAQQIQTLYGQGICLLPTLTQDLIGRDPDLSNLGSLIDAHGFVNVYGLGGIGKSALVRAFAARWPQHLWVEFHDRTGTDRFHGAVAEALGLSHPAIARIGEALESKGRALVVVDGAEHLGPWLLEDIERFRAAAPQVAWIITSRVRFQREPCLALLPLHRDAAIALLRERSDDGVDSDGIAAELVELVGRLPLGVELAAARLRVLPPGELVTWLGEYGIEVIDSPEDGLSATLDSYWGLLDRAQRQCLTVGACMGSSFRADPVGQIVGLHPIATLEALDQLVRSGLIRRQGEVFAMLDLIRAFAAPRLEPELRTSMVTWAVRLATSKRIALDSGGELTLSREELADLVPVFFKALSWTEDEGERAQLLLGIRAHDRAFGPLLRTKEAFDELRLTTLDPTLASRVWLERARLHVEANQRDDALACCHRASALAQSVTDPVTRVLVEAGTAMVTRMRRGSAEAIEISERLADYTERIDAPAPLRIMALTSLESCLTQLGEFDRAHRCIVRALALVDDQPDVEAGLRCRLGYVLAMNGDLPQARVELEHSYAHAKNAGLDRQKVATAKQLSNLYHNIGEFELADGIRHDLVETAERMGDTAGLFHARLSLAGAAVRTDPQRALQLYLIIREQAINAGRAREAALASLNVALIHHEAGRLDQAAQDYRECLSLIEPVGWNYLTSITHCCFALLHAAEGDTARASEQLERASPGAPEAVAIRDATAAALRGDLDQARSALTVASPDLTNTLDTLISIAHNR